MTQYFIVSKEFVEILKKDNQIGRLIGLRKKYEEKGLSYIIGDGIQKELSGITDILHSGGEQQGIIERPIFAVTICIELKKIKESIALKEKGEPIKILESMEEFLQKFEVEVIK